MHRLRSFLNLRPLAAVSGAAVSLLIAPSSLPLPSAATASCSAEARSDAVQPNGGLGVEADGGKKWIHDALTEDTSQLWGHQAAKDKALQERLKNLVVFCGSANPALGEQVANELKQPLGKLSVGRYADGEIFVQVEGSVRGKDVFVIQPTVRSADSTVNEAIIELLLTVSALRRASAKSITAVLPYFGYKRDVGTPASTTQALVAEAHSKTANAGPSFNLAEHLTAASPTGGPSSAATVSSSFPLPGSLPPLDGPSSSSSSSFLLAPTALDRRDPNRTAFPVSAADIARMLQVMGVDRVITMDMRLPGQGQSEGFFDIPVENVRSTALAVDHVAKLLSKTTSSFAASTSSKAKTTTSTAAATVSSTRPPVVIAPNETCIPLAQDFQRGLTKALGVNVGLAIIIEAGPSRGADRYVHVHRRKEDEDPANPRLELVGDVEGCSAAILVDDMIDTGITLMRRLDLIKKAAGPSSNIVAYATHGLFNGAALQRINRSPLSAVIVTNTVPLREDLDTRHTHKIAQLSVAPLIAESILRVQTQQTLQDLRVFDREAQLPRYFGQE